MSIFKRLKNSKHFSALSKKKESITGMVEDLNQRHLAIYHIDSETEGNFSLTVKVKTYYVLDKLDHLLISCLNRTTTTEM